MQYSILFFIFVLVNIYIFSIIFSNSKGTKTVKIKIYVLIGNIIAFFIIQICTSVIWMFTNYKYMQQFGDAAEYLNLSQTLQFDEYRMILYPLLIRLLGRIGELFDVSKIGMTYGFQTIVSFISFFYFINILLRVIIGKSEIKIENINSKKYYSSVLFISLFLVTIPIVTQFNIAILVDSLALSFLLITLSAIMDILLLGKNKLYNYFIIGICLFLQFQLRTERVYLFIVLIICIFIYYFKVLGNYAIAFRSMLPFVLVLIIALTSNVIVNKSIQHPGLYGRPPLSAKIQLIMLPLWPNLELCYDDFPDEFKQIFTKEEMSNADQNANLLTYDIYPRLINSFGQEKTNDLLINCDLVIIKMYPDRIITRAVYNVTQYLLGPVQIIFNLTGVIKNGASEWNFSRMNGATPHLTSFYYKTSLYMLIILLISSVTVAIKLNKKMFINCITALIPMLIICISLSMIFGILTSITPNYRYLLIDYVLWYVFLVILILCVIKSDGDNLYTKSRKCRDKLEML